MGILRDITDAITYSKAKEDSKKAFANYLDSQRDEAPTLLEKVSTSDLGEITTDFGEKSESVIAVKGDDGNVVGVIKVTAYKDPRKKSEYGFYFFDQAQSESEAPKLSDYYNLTCDGNYNDPNALISFDVRFIDTKLPYNTAVAKIESKGESAIFGEIISKKSEPTKISGKHIANLTKILELFRDKHLVSKARDLQPSHSM